MVFLLRLKSLLYRGGKAEKRLIPMNWNNDFLPPFRNVEFVPEQYSMSTKPHTPALCFNQWCTKWRRDSWFCKRENRPSGSIFWFSEENVERSFEKIKQVDISSLLFELIPKLLGSGGAGMMMISFLAIFNFDSVF
ncbi:hypothetical protein U1Q18_006070 [Sarracenia purpurea var. burkii]